jgi:hypothetical protein
MCALLECQHLGVLDPAVGSVRTPVALTARVPTPPMRSTAAPRMPCHTRRPACARDLFFLMVSVRITLRSTGKVGGADKVHTEAVFHCASSVMDIGKVVTTLNLIHYRVGDFPCPFFWILQCHKRLE